MHAHTQSRLTIVLTKTILELTILTDITVQATTASLSKIHAIFASIGLSLSLRPVDSVGLDRMGLEAQFCSEYHGNIPLTQAACCSLASTSFHRVDVGVLTWQCTDSPIDYAGLYSGKNLTEVCNREGDRLKSKQDRCQSKARSRGMGVAERGQEQR